MQLDLRREIGGGMRAKVVRVLDAAGVGVITLLDLFLEVLVYGAGVVQHLYEYTTRMITNCKSALCDINTHIV